MQRPSGDFLVTLEGEMMKIILVQQYRIVVTAVACLASVVNNFTNNYKIVWDCFKRMFGKIKPINTNIYFLLINVLTT